MPTCRFLPSSMSTLLPSTTKGKLSGSLGPACHTHNQVNGHRVHPSVAWTLICTSSVPAGGQCSCLQAQVVLDQLSHSEQEIMHGRWVLPTCIKNSSRQLSRLSKDFCEFTSYTSTQQSAPR